MAATNPSADAPTTLDPMIATITRVRDDLRSLKAAQSIDPNLVQRCSYRPMHSPTSSAFFRRRNRSSSTCETRKTWTAST